MIAIDIVTGGDAIDEARALMREYQISLNVDLCFQDFETELAALPGDYAAPTGLLLLARDAANPHASLLGCGAFRTLPSEPSTCEMKRVYVRPHARGTGAGRMIVERLMATARTCGYTSMVLDTLPQLEVARALYMKLGFVEIEPYYQNPVVGTRYLRAAL
jgi:putative acetyltransferase